jgi:mono/diheme cytochrome c family protein
MPAWEKFLTDEEMWDVDPLPLRLLQPAPAGARERAPLSGIGLRGAIVGAFVALGGASLAGAQQGPPGGALYQKLCSQCHGEQGDGRGIAAPRLTPLPRDFTAGKYKVRTTPNGALPTDGDLRAVIRDGMPYTSMPGWSHLSDAQVQRARRRRQDLLERVHGSRAQAGADRHPRGARRAPTRWRRAARSTSPIGCAACHGELGRGDGLSAPAPAATTGGDRSGPPT